MCFSVFLFYGQQKEPGLKMISEYSENEELRDILDFEGIHYNKIKFVGGEELRDKGYTIRAKEYKSGELVSDTTVINTRQMGIKRLETINDTVLSFRVISKSTSQGKMKIMFRFPSFSTDREFELIETEDEYSLRNIAEESRLSIRYGEPFYLLAYILPYDMGNGFKSYCEVGSNGADIENWGKKFGLEHYLLFEMNFTSE